jgi:predicted nucleic acid-binding protein
VFVVDTSVWIEFFAARWGRESTLLRESLDRVNRVRMCGPILQEVLQGIRDDEVFRREWRNLAQFRYLETTRWTFWRAAALYRLLRRKGHTVNSFDTTIAAVCLENGLPLLTCNRRDFEPMAKYAGLKLA